MSKAYEQLEDEEKEFLSKQTTIEGNLFIKKKKDL